MTKKLSLILMRFLAIITLCVAFSFVYHLFQLSNINYKFLFFKNTTYEILFTLVFIISGSIQVYGFWKLKKWSLLLYIVTSIIYNLFYLISNAWGPIKIIAPIIIIVYVLLNYKNLE